MASATASDVGGISCPVSLSASGFIYGSLSIKQSDIVAMLAQQYPAKYSGKFGASAPTPNLLTGIPPHESGFQQFAFTSLYGVYAPWPHENGATQHTRAGAYIGIMMVQNKMENAFGWKKNVENGVDLYVNQKLTTALRQENRLRPRFPGLRPLAGYQFEDNGLGYYYGLYSDPLQQAWIPGCSGTVSGNSCSSGWIWEFNTANALYTEFVCSVRSQMTGGSKPSYCP